MIDRSAPMLVPPRDGSGIGDYTLRDFAAKWLMQQDDLADIGRYHAANAALMAEQDDRDRIAFIGDSVLEFWPELDHLSGPGWRAVNRGIAGQNSSQMLLRFEDDAVALRPRTAVLLCGTNDLRCYAGSPESVAAGALARISRNVTAIADIAGYHGICLALATLPPVGPQPDVHRSPDGILAVNHWLAGFAETRGLPLIDFHAALVDGQGFLPLDLSDDGVHPNADGYARMLRPLTAFLESKVTT